MFSRPLVRLLTSLLVLGSVAAKASGQAERVYLLLPGPKSTRLVRADGAKMTDLAEVGNRVVYGVGRDKLVCVGEDQGRWVARAYSASANKVTAKHPLKVTLTGFLSGPAPQVVLDEGAGKAYYVALGGADGRFMGYALQELDLATGQEAGFPLPRDLPNPLTVGLPEGVGVYSQTADAGFHLFTWKDRALKQVLPAARSEEGTPRDDVRAVFLPEVGVLRVHAQGRLDHILKPYLEPVRGRANDLAVRGLALPRAVRFD